MADVGNNACVCGNIVSAMDSARAGVRRLEHAAKIRWTWTKAFVC
jgi:hypothetical protein